MGDTQDTPTVEPSVDLDSLYHFTFGSKEYQVNPSHIRIDENDLVREFAEQASRYAYIAVLTSRAENDVKREKMNLKHEEAAASVRARENLVENNIKVTEKAVEAKASMDVGVQGIQGNLLDAEAAYGLLKALEASYRMRADMVVSLGTRLRTEMEQTGMNMKEAPESLMREVVKKYPKQSTDAT